MDRPAPTTSTSTPPITKQPTEPPPSQPLPQPQPQPQPSSSTASPNPNLNPNPPTKPSISAATTITTTPSSTRPQTVHRPWQHPHPHSQFPPVSSGPPIPSSSSTTPSISSPRGVALGVPAPSPASFSSSFGHQFVGLNRAPVNVPESVANTSNSQVRIFLLQFLLLQKEKNWCGYSIHTLVVVWEMCRWGKGWWLQWRRILKCDHINRDLFNHLFDHPLLPQIPKSVLAFQIFHPVSLHLFSPFCCWFGGWDFDSKY